MTGNAAHTRSADCLLNHSPQALEIHPVPNVGVALMQAPPYRNLARRDYMKST